MVLIPLLLVTYEDCVLLFKRSKQHRYGHGKNSMRNVTILPRFLALTVLALITALICHRILSTSKPDRIPVIQELSPTASVAASQEEGGQADGGPRDPEAEDSGIRGTDENLLMRLEPSWGHWANEVRCWPSVGGIIIAQRVHSVELVFLGLDRFYPTARSVNATLEDEFCKKLRMVGGKWWDSYLEFEWAIIYKMRAVWPDERDMLYLGWPKDKKGVWLLRFENWKADDGDIGTIFNALTMDERCLGIKISGGMFFENPEDSEYIAPLVRGFGNRKMRKYPTMPEDGGSWDF